MSENVIRTGVPFDRPCPDAPQDDHEWITVIIHGEWRFLRGMRKVQLREGEIAIHMIGAPPQIVRTHP